MQTKESKVKMGDRKHPSVLSRQQLLPNTPELGNPWYLSFGALLNSIIELYTLTLSMDFPPSLIVDSPTCYHVLLLQVDWFIPSSETRYSDLVFSVKTISLFRNWFDTNWFLLLMFCFSTVLEIWEDRISTIPLSFSNLISYLTWKLSISG